MCTLHDFMQGGHTLSYIVGPLSGCGIYMWSKNAIVNKYNLMVACGCGPEILYKRTSLKLLDQKQSCP